MAYGLPEPRGEEYCAGFVDALTEFVNEKYARGWFMDKDDMLNHYRDKWTEAQSFAAETLWDLADFHG